MAVNNVSADSLRAAGKKRIADVQIFNR